jgi:hypothetical protein
MQAAFNLNPPVYPIIAERLGQGNFSSLARFSSFRWVVIVGLPRSITHGCMRRHRLADWKSVHLVSPFEDIAIAVWRFRYDSEQVALELGRGS